MNAAEHEALYRDMWLAGVESCPAAVGNTCLTNHSFCARHHSYRSYHGWPGRGEHGVYINETFESVFECLAFYRWFRVPQRLQSLCLGSGASPIRDIEVLLDRSGYSVSLTVEELFHMMDACLGSGKCSPDDLHRIRLAYNGISGFHEPTRAEIVCWGPVQDVLADSSLHGRLEADGGSRNDLMVLVDSGLFDPRNSSHIVAADRFLRRTSAV